MAMQRFGEPGGPKTKEEEVTDTELNWLVLLLNALSKSRGICHANDL